MMGGFGGTSSRPMTVTAQQAQDAAQRWLDANRAGASVKAPDSFYGFYTIDFEKAGQLVGMLSVNGYTGQVWYHSWHGTFIQLKDLGASGAA
jgi:heat shock protein HslJ